MLIQEDHQQQQHVVVNSNAADHDHIDMDDNNITLLNCVPTPPEPAALVMDNPRPVIEKETDERVVKPSFIDILKANPNLEFEDKMKKKIKSSSVYNVSSNSNSSITNIIVRACAQVAGGTANLQPSDAKDRVAVRAAERRVWAAKSTKDGIQQRLDLKQADCDEAKSMYDAALSDEQALKCLLEAKNIEISKAQSELKRFKNSGGTVDNKKGLVLLADGLTSIQDALRSSGIGIHDLDWTELVDELLKPMKLQVVSLKENIQKAEITTKGSKKNYDKRNEELEGLKVQLKEAEGALQQAKGELRSLQNKDINDEMDLDHQVVNEAYKEDAGTNSEKTADSINICMDKTSESEVGLSIKEVDDAGEGDLVEEPKKEEEVKKEELSNIEIVERDTNMDEIHNCAPAKKLPNKRERRAIAKAGLLLALKEKADNEDVRVKQTECRQNRSSKVVDEYGCNSEQAVVSQQVLQLNTNEIDDDENTWNEEELEKMELSKTENGEEDEEEIISDDDSGNYLTASEIEGEEIPSDENHKYPSGNKKKQKKLARKARRARAKARAADLKALEEGNGEGVGFMKMPFVIGLMIVLVLLWCVI